MNAVGGEEGTRNEPVAENKSYGNVNDDDDDEELAKISELEATPKPPQAAQERVRLFCGCAGPEVSRKTRLVTLSVCGVVSFLAVAAVVTIVAIWSTIKQVKDFRSCWINVCDHGVEVSDAKIIDMGNITRFAEVANDASFSCAKSFEESTRDGTGKVYAAVTVYNPNPYEARIVNTVVHIDATPEIPVGSDNALALKLKDLSARVMECEVPSIRVKKGDNLVAATCTIFLKDTVLGRSMQAYLDGYKVNLKQRAMARVNVLGIRDFKMDETTDLVLAPTTLHPSYLPPGAMPPPPAPLGIVANNNNNDFFGNTAKCPGTTDLHFDLPTVFVCGIYFTNSVASTLTSMIGSVMGNSDSGVDVELDGTIALHNPTAFPVVVQYAQVRMIHDDGATVARLADSILVPSNYTELLVFRASVPASEATAVASKLLEGRLRMNVTGQIDIAMLTTEFTINIKETPVIASEMDEEFSSAMGGTHRRALAQQSELELGSKGSAYDIALSLAQGKCLCVYHCGSDAEHSTMLSLRNTTTRDNVTPNAGTEAAAPSSPADALWGFLFG